MMQRAAEILETEKSSIRKIDDDRDGQTDKCRHR